MFEFLKKLNLQLFADGGDGGEGTGEAEGSATSGADIPSRIPERARAMYAEALAKTKAKSEPKAEAHQETTTESPKEASEGRVSYEDLIKGEYKDEHKAYMDKVIGDRLKGVKGENKRMKDALGIVSVKYGLDPNSPDFMDALSAKLNEDTSYYEDYAIEHNISPEDAKEILTLKHQVKAQEEERKAQEAEEKQNEFIRQLRQKAEMTKAQYPNFNLEAELQNPSFRELVAATHGDTTAAYRTIHYDEIMRAQGLQAAQRANQQVANSVAANARRPIENGLSSQASSVSEVDWSKASLEQIRAYAAEQRRLKR